MLISHLDPRLQWIGAISLERTPEYTRAWRLPFEEEPLFYPILRDRAKTTAGIRLTFRSDTRVLKGARVATPEPGKLDLYLDGVHHGTIDMLGQESFDWSDLPEGEKLIELWLPQRADFALTTLELSDGASLTAHRDQRPVWVTYGSSITHCGEAASPSTTWPGIVAREQNLNHYNLGFGGQCHLDPLMIRTIRDIPHIDFLSICAGINIYGSSSLNEHTFGAALIGAIITIRERHPHIPIAVISSIYSFNRETTKNSCGLSLDEYRELTQNAVTTLRTAGDRNLFYFNGLSLYDESLGHLMPDDLHPNAEGYEKLAEGFLREVGPTLFCNTPRP